MHKAHTQTQQLSSSSSFCWAVKGQEGLSTVHAMCWFSSVGRGSTRTGEGSCQHPPPSFPTLPPPLPSGDCSGEKRLGKRAQHRATSLSAQAFFTEGLLSTFMMPCGGWSVVT